MPRTLITLGWAVLWAVGGTALVLVLGVILTLAGLLPGLWALLPNGPGVAMLGLVLGAMLVLHARRRRATVVLRYVHQAVGRNQPLPELLLAAERSDSGMAAARLGRLRREVEAGRPLAASLRLAVPELDRRTAGCLEAAERMGRLPEELAHQLGRRRRALPRNLGSDALALAYATTVALMLLVMLNYCLVAIVPKFNKIFDDFGTPLPDTTQALIGLANWLAGPLHNVPGNPHRDALLPGVFYLLPWLVALVGLAGGWALRAICVGGRNDWGGAAGLFDEVLWRLPVLGPVLRDNQLADVGRSLALALGSGLDWPRALAEARTLEVNSVLRNKLARWQAAAEGGLPVGEALQHAGMPRLWEGILAGGHGPGLPAALEFLARHHASRFSRARHLLRGAILPAVVLVLGLAVGWVLVALMLPLEALLSALTSRALIY